MPVLNVTIVKGNIVTPHGVLYGGHIIVVGDTIHAVAASDIPIPSAEELHASLLGAKKNKKKGRGEAEKEEEPVSIMLQTMEAPFVVPGFVDIHNHGVGGIDEVCDHWTVPEFSQKHLAKCGTLSTLASVIFSSTRPEATKKVIDSIESRVGKYYDDCCVIEGVHAEGPIIADCGGLPQADTDMSLPAFKKLCSTMPNMKIMTISPSKEKLVGYERLKHLLELGVRPSLGHDRSAPADAIITCMKMASEIEPTRKANADGDDANEQSARRRDATHRPPHASKPLSGPPPSASSPQQQQQQLHSTHLYNVMSSHHRDPSLVNFCLCNRLPAGKKYRNCVPPTVEVIADLIHVHPVAIQALLSSRSYHDIAVISDCISQYEPGKHLKYNGRGIAVRAEGGCYLTDSTGRPTRTLAGSTVTLADQFFTLITHFGLDIHVACTLLATTPARIAKIDHRVGSLTEGLKANILLLNGEMNTITNFMVYGRWIRANPYRMLKPVMSNL